MFRLEKYKKKIIYKSNGGGQSGKVDTLPFDAKTELIADCNILIAQSQTQTQTCNFKTSTESFTRKTNNHWVE